MFPGPSKGLPSPWDAITKEKYSHSSVPTSCRGVKNRRNPGCLPDGEKVNTLVVLWRKMYKTNILIYWPKVNNLDGKTLSSRIPYFDPQKGQCLLRVKWVKQECSVSFVSTIFLLLKYKFYAIILSRKRILKCPMSSSVFSSFLGLENKCFDQTKFSHLILPSTDRLVSCFEYGSRTFYSTVRHMS